MFSIGQIHSRTNGDQLIARSLMGSFLSCENYALARASEY